MDLKVIETLPAISKPRKGLLEKVERSENDLSDHEAILVTDTFKSFDIDNQGLIQLDELKTLLLNINLKIDDDILEDYLNKFYEDQRRQAESMDRQQLVDFIILVMKNQSETFRRIYNGAKKESISLEEIILKSREDARAIFNAYDLNQNSFLEYEELRELLIDLGHDTLFLDQSNAEDAFEEHVHATWFQYDKNQDGYINFEEFLPIHSELIDN